MNSTKSKAIDQEPADLLANDATSLDLLNKTRNRLAETQAKRAIVSKELLSMRQEIRELRKETDLTIKEQRKTKR